MRKFRTNTGIVIFVVLFFLCSTLLMLPGCGGGGGTHSAPGGGNLPEGNGSFSGRITNELGKGLEGVKVEAVPGNSDSGELTSQAQTLSQSEGSGVSPATGTSSDALPETDLNSTTDEDGQFSLTGLVVGQTYNLTVTREGRKTLKSTFTVDENIPDFSIILIAPKGEGEVEFTMPMPLHLEQPVTHGDTVDLEWENSINPGFLAYIIYRAKAEGAGTTATQLEIKMAPNDVTYTDTLKKEGQVFYYRVYEKILLPELGTFIMVGSNEVKSIFPHVESFSPKGGNLPLAQIIEISFNTEMDKKSVEEGFSITSSYDKDVFNGTKSWEGNKFIFTPSQNFGYGRDISVSLSNIKDIYDSSPIGSLKWSFHTKCGYDTPADWITPLTTPCGEIAVSDDGKVFYLGHLKIIKLDEHGHCISEWDTINGDIYNFFDIIIDFQDNLIAVRNSEVVKYDQNGEKLMTWLGYDDIYLDFPYDIATDTDGNIYITASYCGIPSIVKFTTSFILIEHWDESGKALACGPDNLLYVSNGYNLKVLNCTGDYISEYQFINGYGDGQIIGGIKRVAVDASKIYITDMQRVQVFDHNGNFITKIRYPTYQSTNLTGSLAVDKDSNIYLGGHHIYKFTPESDLQ